MYSYKKVTIYNYFCYCYFLDVPIVKLEGKINRKAIYCREVFGSVLKKLTFTWVNISYKQALIYEKKQWTAKLIMKKSKYTSMDLSSQNVWKTDLKTHSFLGNISVTCWLAWSLFLQMWQTWKVWKLLIIWNANNNRRTKSGLKKYMINTKIVLEKTRIYVTSWEINP